VPDDAAADRAGGSRPRSYTSTGSPTSTENPADSLQLSAANITVIALH